MARSDDVIGGRPGGGEIAAAGTAGGLHLIYTITFCALIEAVLSGG